MYNSILKDTDRGIAMKEFENNLPDKINNPYVWEKKNSLSGELCKKIIKRFELDNRYWSDGGVLSNETIIKSNGKITKELNISCYSQVDNWWKEIDNILNKKLREELHEYSIRIEKKCNNTILRTLMDKNLLEDEGYNLQRYIKNKGMYVWHEDSRPGHHKTRDRLISFIWYLNTVEEGGETYMYNGKVKPEEGKLLFFPSSWNYNHKGNIPNSSNKYIIVGMIKHK